MPRPLPMWASLDWLKKSSKDELVRLRAMDEGAKLADAQLAVAREYGFASWRELKAHVERARSALDRHAAEVSEHVAAAPPVDPDDEDLASLFAAIQRGDAVTFARLVGARPELVGGRGHDGLTPLHAAAQSDDPRMGVMLLAQGADPGARFGPGGHTPLSWAVVCHALSFGATLVRAGVKPDLYCAAGLGLLEHVRAWFDASGALKPRASWTGSTREDETGDPLPAPPDTAEEQLADALSVACRNGHAEVVRLLLSRGADPAFRSFLGATALHWAYFGRSREAIAAVLHAGGDPEVRDRELGVRPRAFGICASCRFGFPFLVREQLAFDPTLAVLEDEGTTPLHEAARSGSAEVVRLLLSAGASPGTRDAVGATARDVAEAHGHADIAALLS